MENKETYFKQWSVKLSIPLKDIENDFQSTLDEISKEQPEASDDDKLTLALKRMAISYKKRMRSPADAFEGIILGAEETRDVIARQRKDALDFYKENPQLAVQQGVTNEDGIPLDTRKEWSSGKLNRNFGNPLPEKSLIRKIFGVALKSKDNGEPKYFTMTLNGDKCNQEIPIMKPIKFLGIEKTSDNKGMVLNPSVFTEFKVDETVQLPPVKELIEKYMDVIKIENLETYHKTNKDDYSRMCVIEANVSLLNLEPTSVGSRIVVIEDADNIMDIDAKGITCWVPQNIEINFSEGDKVYVIGKTSQGKLKDENGNLTEEDGDITINVTGILPLETQDVPKVDSI